MEADYLVALALATGWPIAEIGRGNPGRSSLIRYSVGEDRRCLLDRLGKVLQRIDAFQAPDGFRLLLLIRQKMMLESLVNPPCPPVPIHGVTVTQHSKERDKAKTRHTEYLTIVPSYW